MKKVLIVDDDHSIRRLLCEWLREYDYNVDCLSGAHAAQKVLSGITKIYDLIICDVLLGDETGTESVEIAKVFGLSTPVLFITGYPEIVVPEKYPVMCKPFLCSEFLSKVEELIGKADDNG